MMNCNRNRQMVKRRIYSFQMDGESRAEAICLSYWRIGMEMNQQNNLFLVTKCWVIMFLSVGTLL